MITDGFIEEFRRVGRACIVIALMVGAFAAMVFAWSRFALLERRVEELRGFRVGVPATMLPEDRRFQESTIVYKGEKMTARYYPSAANGPAANADYLVIVNREGIVEAAFSTDLEAGREWMGEHP